MDGIKAQKLHDEIIAKVAEYYELVHAPMQNPPFEPGKSKVNYAGRVFDSNEMTNLADAALEFWLTSGRYTREFEKKLAKVLGVKFALLVNSGSSARTTNAVIHSNTTQNRFIATFLLNMQMIIRQRQPATHKTQVCRPADGKLAVR